ncbi:MAG: hypothetical protein ABH875_04035, partial [Candidatus Omnitrophota bacterium]
VEIEGLSTSTAEIPPLEEVMANMPYEPEWLDTELKTLGGKTPRQALVDKKDLVEELIREIGPLLGETNVEPLEAVHYMRGSKHAEVYDIQKNGFNWSKLEGREEGRSVWAQAEKHLREKRVYPTPIINIEFKGVLARNADFVAIFRDKINPALRKLLPERVGHQVSLEMGGYLFDLAMVAHKIDGLLYQGGQTILIKARKETIESGEFIKTEIVSIDPEATTTDDQVTTTSSEADSAGTSTASDDADLGLKRWLIEKAPILGNMTDAELDGLIAQAREEGPEALRKMAWSAIVENGLTLEQIHHEGYAPTPNKVIQCEESRKWAVYLSRGEIKPHNKDSANVTFEFTEEFPVMSDIEHPKAGELYCNPKGVLALKMWSDSVLVVWRYIDLRKHKPSRIIVDGGAENLQRVKEACEVYGLDVPVVARDQVATTLPTALYHARPLGTVEKTLDYMALNSMGEISTTGFIRDAVEKCSFADKDGVNAESISRAAYALADIGQFTGTPEAATSTATEVTATDALVAAIMQDKPIERPIVAATSTASTLSPVMPEIYEPAQVAAQVMPQSFTRTWTKKLGSATGEKILGIGDYLKALYGAIARDPEVGVIDKGHLEVTRNRGANGAIRNGTRGMEMYVVIINTDKLAPYIRKGVRMDGAVDPNLFDSNGAKVMFGELGYKGLTIIEANDADDLAEKLKDERYKNAGPDNTFIYTENTTPGATMKEVRAITDAGGNKAFKEHMMANIAVPSQGEGVPFVSLGGLIMLAICAIDLKHIKTASSDDLGHIYELLAELQLKDPAKVKAEFVWEVHPAEVFINGTFSIELPPISPQEGDRDLRKFYREEKRQQNFLRAL